LPENAAAIPTAAEDTAAVPPTSTTQPSEVADSLAPPLASPLPSATSHSVDPEMESAKRTLEEFQNDDPLTEEESDVPAPPKRAKKGRKTTGMTSKKTHKGRK